MNLFVEGEVIKALWGRERELSKEGFFSQKKVVVHGQAMPPLT
jgi:hypothetical protein